MARKNKIAALLAVTACVIGLSFLWLRANNAPSFTEFHSPPPPDNSRERPFHIINLSLPKTGTGSIAGLFDRHKSADEFMYIEAVEKILDWREGLIDGATLDRFLLERDAAKKFQVDSASFLALADDRVIPLFPKAKFLLSVRDGEEWIVSFTGMMVDFYGPNQRGKKLSKSWATRYGKAMAPGFTLEAFSDPARLGERVGPLLQDLASFWGRTTLETLQRLRQVPKDRRLVLHTKDLSHSLDRLAEFAGVPVESLNGEKTHRNKGKNLSQIRESLGREAIAEAVKPWQEKIDALLAEYDSENHHPPTKK